MDMPLTPKVEDEPTMPLNSPRGQLQVNNMGDMSLTFRFPAEVTSWSHVSAQVEFSPQGGDILGQAFEVCNVPISPHVQTHNVTLQSPVSRICPNPITPQAPISCTHPGATILSPISRTYPDLEPTHGSPSAQCCPPTPLEYLSPHRNHASSFNAVHPLDNDPFVHDDNKPMIVQPNYTLANLPNPIYPTAARGTRLPWALPHPKKYYVVIKGFKIGIFLEKW